MSLRVLLFSREFEIPLYSQNQKNWRNIFLNGKIKDLKVAIFWKSRNIVVEYYALKSL